jgi:pimeloyl-ACP methyl ester carboxylesterase
VLVGQLAGLGSPADVRKWWDALSDSDRQLLLAGRPDLVGNLDGVPPDVRYAANRANIQAEIDRLTAAGAPSSRIDALKALLDPNRQIMLFDPTGDGRIAEVFGNLKTADDIAVVVPGIGNSLANYSPEYARNIREAAHGDTATIMWVGYDTPSAPKDLNVLDPSAVSAGRAKEWAPTLVSFTDGLRTSGQGEIAIVAHSYGTVLVTEAAKAGMQVDRVILLGSPGVPADNAGVFKGADVFAAKNTLDYVPAGSTHGTDPTSAGFGAHGLPGNPLRAFDHSSYFNPGSNALHGIVGAIEGARSGPDGMVVNRYVNQDGSAEDIWTGTY